MSNQTTPFANSTSSSAVSASVIPETLEPSCATNATSQQRSRSPSPRTVGHFRLFVEKFKRNTAGRLSTDNDMMHKLQYMLDQFGPDNRLIRSDRDSEEQRQLDEAQRRRTERKAQALKQIAELKRAIALRDEQANQIDIAPTTGKSVLKPPTLLVSPQQSQATLVPQKPDDGAASTSQQFDSPTSAGDSFRKHLPSPHPSSFELSSLEPGPKVATPIIDATYNIRRITSAAAANAATILDDIIHKHHSSTSLTSSSGVQQQQQASALATIQQHCTSTTTSGDGKRFSHVQTIKTTVTNHMMPPPATLAVQHKPPPKRVQRKNANASMKPPQRRNRRAVVTQQPQRNPANNTGIDESRPVAVAVATIPVLETSTSSTYPLEDSIDRQQRPFHALYLQRNMVRNFQRN